MALRRGFGRDMSKVHDGRGRSGPKTFWIPQSKGTTLVLLDDDPVIVNRHQLFIKGDKKAAGLRCTCAGFDPEEHKEAQPRLCLVCNEAIRDQRIGRRPLAYLSCIDERNFEWKGKTYQDMKCLLELDKKGYDLFEHRKATYGSLVGAQFKVYRSKASNSPRYGDDWQYIQRVDLVRHFWQSPGVPRLIEAEQRRGQTISHHEAVQRLVQPINYDEVMGQYDPNEAEIFIAYAKGGEAAADQRQGQQQAAPGGYQAPPPPFQQQATVPAAPAPEYAVPAGQAPAYAPQPQPQQQQAPAYQPAPQPTAAIAPPPPPVPDPASASPLPGGYVAPPMPSAAPAPAPTPQQAPAYPPAPAQAPVPTQAAPPPPAPGAPPSAPQQGWSSAPPFPQPQQPPQQQVPPQQPPQPQQSQQPNPNDQPF